jgi:hypothetical protein
MMNTDEIFTQKKPTDWELVEKHFRAGILSNVQIAAECGVSEGAIRKRAKRDGWTKDLKAKIKARAEELVRKETVRTVRTSLTPASEKQTVEVNAQAAAVVLIAQKGSIRRGHELFKKLMEELEMTSNNRELFEQLGELLDKSSEDDGGQVRQDKLKAIFMKVISLTGRIDSAKKMIETFEKIVRMERLSYGIDVDEGGDNRLADALKTLMEMKKNGIVPTH